jgi:hypothetical protein
VLMKDMRSPRVAWRTLMTALLLAMAGMLAVVPAAASGPPETQWVESTFPDVNPCTGEDHLVTLAGPMRIHTIEPSQQDRHHAQWTWDATVSTSDGWVGQDRGFEIDNGGVPAVGDDEYGMYATGHHAVARSADGAAFRVAITIHATVAGGEVVVFVEGGAADCLGR